MLEVNDPDYVLTYITNSFAAGQAMPHVIPMTPKAFDNLHAICLEQGGIVVTPINSPKEVYGPNHVFRLGDLFAGATFVCLH